MSKVKLRVNKQKVEAKQMTLFPDVSPEVTYRIDDDMYHTCRWCKHYKEGVCKEIEFENDSIVHFVENGDVHDVVREAFSDLKFMRFQDFLKSNTRLSEKMVHEAMYRIHTDLEQAKEQEWIDSIVASVFNLLNNNATTNFTPPDPNTFYCNRWE